MSFWVEADRGGEQGRDRADDGDDHCDAPSAHYSIDRRQTAQTMIDASGDHGRRVDQGRHRRRAFHRVRQPGVQEELRRLAHRADEEQQADARQIQHRTIAAPRKTISRSCRLHCVPIRGEQFVSKLMVPYIQKIVDDPQNEAEVADAVDDKGLDGGGALAVGFLNQKPISR